MPLKKLGQNLYKSPTGRFLEKVAPNKAKFVGQMKFISKVEATKRMKK